MHASTSGSVAPDGEPTSQDNSEERCSREVGCLATTGYAGRAMTGDLRTKLIDEMKAVFGDDRPRIDHAMGVLGFAEQILAGEQEVAQRGGFPHPPLPDATIVIAAAILHDIGIHAAEATHGSGAGRYQEIEGPPVARAILEKLNVAPAATDHICNIIAHHHNGQIDTPEFNVIWDADWLVNIPDAYPNAAPAKLAAAITKIFRTPTGRAIAEELFLAGAWD